jgi:hypothetical protein
MLHYILPIPNEEASVLVTKHHNLGPLLATPGVLLEIRSPETTTIEVKHDTSFLPTELIDVAIWIRIAHLNSNDATLALSRFPPSITG